MHHNLPNPSNIKSIDDFIQLNYNNLPPEYFPTNREITRLKYMSKFEGENSKKDPNNKTYDWEYTVNKYGFRDIWRFEPNTKRIGFFGCSCTFGVGVDSRTTFVKLVESHYGPSNVECFNMGLPGAGTQRIAKLVSASQRLLNFDAVVLTLPTSSRFLMLNQHNLMIDFVPGFIRSDFEAEEKFIYGKFGQNNLDMYFIDYVHWIQAELKSVKKVFWSTWCQDSYKLLKTIIDKESLLPHFNFVDHGRDIHPGIKSHYLYSKNIINALGNLNG